MVISSSCRDAVAAAYERNADALFRIALAQLQNSEDAQDAVHDAFSRFIKSAPSFDSTEQERAWLIRVTVNVCHDLQRKRRHRTHLSLDDALEVADSDTTWQSDERNAIMSAISALPEKYRIAVVLHYLEDLPIDRAAHAAGISESAMKMRLLRAREMMQKTIGREM